MSFSLSCLPSWWNIFWKKDFFSPIAPNMAGLEVEVERPGRVVVVPAPALGAGGGPS